MDMQVELSWQVLFHFQIVQINRKKKSYRYPVSDTQRNWRELKMQRLHCLTLQNMNLKINQSHKDSGTNQEITLINKAKVVEGIVIIHLERATLDKVGSGNPLDNNLIEITSSILIK